MIVLDSQAALDGLIDRIADAVIERLQSGAAQGGKLAVREGEAAQMLGIPQHRLKAARLRGEITASRCGRAYLYATSELRGSQIVESDHKCDEPGGNPGSKRNSVSQYHSPPTTRN